MKKRIVLCADDYGQAPAISQGIINLLQTQRLSATSCMVNTDYWPEHAQWLLAFQGKADIGLHFNLTQGRALSQEYRQKYGEVFRPLPQVLARACMHLFDQSAIEAELHAQLDKFEQVMGFVPSHIDGHQHAHQFPVIRSALAGVYKQRLRPHKVYIRYIYEPLKPQDFFRHFKKVIIYAAGTQGMKRLLEREQIPHNQTFAGIYSFPRAKEYAAFFPQFLQRVEDRGLIMCHAGLAQEANGGALGVQTQDNSATRDSIANERTSVRALEVQDSIAEARYAEYQYLASYQLLKDCEAQGVVLSRFQD
jgi:predicted glycoside hydrolase/deacetylase ChbG (UPF0249 family)